MVHEAAHTASPLQINGLSTLERLQFQKKLCERVMALDRYPFTYVESIRTSEKITDEKTRMYRMTSEYWAELCAFVLKNPDQHANMSQADLNLVAFVLKECRQDDSYLEPSSFASCHSETIAEYRREIHPDPGTEFEIADKRAKEIKQKYGALYR